VSVFRAGSSERLGWHRGVSSWRRRRDDVELPPLHDGFTSSATPTIHGRPQATTTSRRNGTLPLTYLLYCCSERALREYRPPWHATAYYCTAPVREHSENTDHCALSAMFNVVSGRAAITLGIGPHSSSFFLIILSSFFLA